MLFGRVISLVPIIIVNLSRYLCGTRRISRRWRFSVLLAWIFRGRFRSWRRLIGRKRRVLLLRYLTRVSRGR